MTATVIYRCLLELGVEVRLDGDRPRLVGAVASVHPALLADVRDCRADIIALVAGMEQSLAEVEMAAARMDRKFPRGRLGSLILALARQYRTAGEADMLTDAAALCRRLLEGER